MANSHAATTISATWTVTGIGEDGTYETEYVITNVAVADEGDPAMVEGLRTQMASMVGTTITLQLDSRRRVLQAETAVPAGYVSPAGLQPSQFDTMTTNLTPPLPEEPVGEGAVWESLATDASMGFEVATVTTLTLDELRQDGGFTATADLRSAGESQEMELPGMPAGAEASVDYFDLNGSYRWEVEPSRLVPRLDSRASAAAGFTVGGIGEDMRMKMTVEMGVEARPGAEE